MSIAAASLTIDELEEDIRQANARRYEFYRMLNATDRVLWRLEELNLRGVRDLPSGLGVGIRNALAELPETCLEPLVGGRVQEVLDSVFEVQERLLRLRDPHRVVAEEPDYNGADLIRWAGVCRWLESQPEGVVRQEAPQEHFADLEALHAHLITFVRGNAHRHVWLVRGDWPARLERMRVRLEAGGRGE